MAVSPVGSTMEGRLLQFANADSPMVVTAEGILTEVSEGQLLKAL